MNELDQAAIKFVEAHNPSRIDVAHIGLSFGSVSEYLNAEGQPTGDSGGRYIEIFSSDSIDGTPKIIEWFENAWQIKYYTKPFSERVGPKDQTPHVEFDPDFDFAVGKAIRLLTKNDFYDLTVIEYRNGKPFKDLDINSYID